MREGWELGLSLRALVSDRGGKDLVHITESGIEAARPKITSWDIWSSHWSYRLPFRLCLGLGDRS